MLLPTSVSHLGMLPITTTNKNSRANIQEIWKRVPTVSSTCYFIEKSKKKKRERKGRVRNRLPTARNWETLQNTWTVLKDRKKIYIYVLFVYREATVDLMDCTLTISSLFKITPTNCFGEFLPVHLTIVLVPPLLLFLEDFDDLLLFLRDFVLFGGGDTGAERLAALATVLRHIRANWLFSPIFGVAQFHARISLVAWVLLVIAVRIVGATMKLLDASLLCKDRRHVWRFCQGQLAFQLVIVYLQIEDDDARNRGEIFVEKTLE